MECAPENPRMYLSFDRNGWRVIYAGTPYCADTDEAMARKILAYHAPKGRHPIPTILWDGEAGAWIVDPTSVAPSPA